MIHLPGNGRTRNVSGHARGQGIKHRTRLRSLVAWVASLALLGVGVTASPAVALKNGVSLCHIDAETGLFKVINVSRNGQTVASHTAHGDGLPEGPVPGMAGYEFDSSCGLVVMEVDTDGDGISDSDDNCLTVPNADQANRYGSAAGDACEDSNLNGTFDVDEPHICVSVNGVSILSTGIADCGSDQSSSAEPNTAIAIGLARAFAERGSNNAAFADGELVGAFASDGDNNTATAIGYSTEAWAEQGSNNVATARAGAEAAYASGGNGNTATATGAGAIASAGQGNGNNATATGFGAYADARVGDNNSATATGELTSVIVGYGDNNTAIATGDFSIVQAAFGNDNTVTAEGAANYGSASSGNGNTATVVGNDSEANAHFGDNNTATATGDNAYACAGGTFAGGDQDNVIAANVDLCS